MKQAVESSKNEQSFRLVASKGAGGDLVCSSLVG
jgi:hypothetical protein